MIRLEIIEESLKTCFVNRGALTGACRSGQSPSSRHLIVAQIFTIPSSNQIVMMFFNTSSKWTSAFGLWFYMTGRSYGLNEPIRGAVKVVLN